MLQKVISEVQQYGATLIAVSKTKPITQIQEFYNEGQRDFGENKVQELIEKEEALPKDIRWHMIGNLQTNKVKYIAPFVHLIHSVDRMSLLKEVNKQGKKNDRQIPILLQLKIALEESKNGASLEEIQQMIDAINDNKYPWVSLRGLMGMATFTDDQTIVRSEFKKLKSTFVVLKPTIQETNQFTEISMGMSGDYQLALQEGSTMVRIGSLLFGHRN